MENKRWFSRVLPLVFLLVISLAFWPVQKTQAQGTPPNITNIQIVLYTKSNSETEVSHYLRWTETAPRNQMEMILDCWGGDLGFGDVTVYSEGQRRFNLKNDEDLGKVGESGAFHRHRLVFPETTKVGGDYELAVGYGSRLITNSNGPNTFNWTANPWPFSVQRYEVNWVGQAVSADFQYTGDFSLYDQQEKFDPTSMYKQKTLAIRLVKQNAAAGFTPVVYFSYGAAAKVQPTSVPVQVKPASPVAQPTMAVVSKPTPEKRGGNVCGSIFVVLILVCVVGISGIAWMYFSRKRRQPSEEELTPPVHEPAPSPPKYEEPKVKREARPKRVNVAVDLTQAEVAYLLGSTNAKIILACVRALEKRGLIVILSKDPLQMKIRPQKVQQADQAGNLSRADQAVIEAITNDGVVDVNETEVIVACVRAAGEMKIAEREADRERTREYYGEQIRQLEEEVRRQERPVVYVEHDDDIWFWLWLTDRYRYSEEPTPGTYRYPVPSKSVYVGPDGTPRPVTDETFRQTLADFEKPREGLAAEITEAAARAARKITGAAAGEEPSPSPKPHDACVQPHSQCVVRQKSPHDACVHDQCVAAHDACVQPHSQCVTKPHDACVHSDCVRHDVHSAHSACVASHSACAARAR